MLIINIVDCLENEDSLKRSRIIKIFQEKIEVVRKDKLLSFFEIICLLGIIKIVLDYENIYGVIVTVWKEETMFSIVFPVFIVVIFQLQNFERMIEGVVEILEGLL